MKKNAIFLMAIMMTVFFSSCKRNNNGSNNTGTTISCNNITSNTTWNAGVYSIDCIIDIRNNAVLTISPGTTLKFTGNGGLTTSNGGAIFAEGTASAPIIFTGREEIKGYWISVDILTNSNNTSFAYCEFKYGGQGNVTMVHVGDGGSIGRAKFQHCTFSNGSRNGLYVAANSFIDNTGNNTFTGNDEFPVSCTLESVSQFDQSNTYTGNGKDYINVNSDYQCYADVHFRKLPVPYYLTATSNNLFNIYGHWTIDPGTVLALGADMELEIKNSGGQTGSINCVGTASDHIIIKGYQSSQGYWDKIRFFESNENNQIIYTDLSDGGSYADNIWGDPGMITALTISGSNRLTMNNCTLSNSLKWGIYISSSNSATINGVSGAAAIQSTLQSSNNFSNCALGNVHTQ